MTGVSAVILRASTVIFVPTETFCTIGQSTGAGCRAGAVCNPDPAHPHSMAFGLNDVEVNFHWIELIREVAASRPGSARRAISIAFSSGV